MEGGALRGLEYIARLAFFAHRVTEQSYPTQTAKPCNALVWEGRHVADPFVSPARGVRIQPTVPTVGTHRTNYQALSGATLLLLPLSNAWALAQA